MTARALGWVPDAHDDRDWTWDQGLAAFSASGDNGLARADHRSVRGARTYQGGAGACVAFAESRCIYMSQRLAGAAEPAFASQQWLYNIGRRRVHAGVDPRIIPLPPLQDVGMYPRLAIEALRALGYVPLNDCPYDPLTVNEDLDPALVTMAYGQRDLRYYRITETGRDRMTRVAEAMRTKHTVLFGMQVDTAFMNFDGDGVISGVDLTKRRGGHMMAMLAVDDSLVGTIDNWWHDWGAADGTGRIDPDLFGDPAIISDVLAIAAAPTFGG